MKAPKAITHEKKLERCGSELAAFFTAIEPVREKLGPILVQLPPRLSFEEGTAHEFFTTLRELYAGEVVLEPRNASWFTSRADHLLRGFEVSRAMADPATGSALAGEPGGWPALRYYRLHGAPKTYWSEYSSTFLEDLAHRLTGEGNAWVVFDNTAQGHAYGNALQLTRLLEDLHGTRPED